MNVMCGGYNAGDKASGPIVFIIRSADYRFTMRTTVLHDLQIRDMCTSDPSTDYNFAKLNLFK